MSTELKDFKPQSVWKNFYELTQIPRPSKKEAQVADFVKQFGNKLGLETQQDETGNILIKKPATKGMESKKTIVLQAHLDMVPQKNNDKEHDFEKDPINVYVNGEWVTADGTTLGADNGIGVAAAMAVLEADDVKHGPVEALFTVDEESGMTGAFGMKSDFLSGDILLNLDSEDEGELFIGCAGGMEANVKLKYDSDESPAYYTGYRVSLSGLAGGHSGLDIHLERGNANKLLNRFIKHVTDKLGVRLSCMNGGNLRNAIPREAYADVIVPDEQIKPFESKVKEYEALYKHEIGDVDPNVKLEAKQIELPVNILGWPGQMALLDAIYAVPHGVVRKSTSMENLVETSNNLAVVKTKDGETYVQTLIRSSVDSAKHDVGQMIRAVMELAGGEVSFTGEYPGWKPNPDSEILSKMKDVYNKEFGKVPEVKALHAGLETGLLGSLYPNMDMISFGPTIKFPHSPDEKIHSGSVEKFWTLLKKTLEAVE